MTPAFIVKGDDGEDYGPVDLGELREWVRENRAGLGTTVKTDEPGALWQPWQYYPELVALLAEMAADSSIGGSILAPLGRRMAAFLLDLILAYLLMVPVLFVVWIAFFPGDFVHWQVAAQTMLSTGQPAYMNPPAPLTDQLIFCGIIILYIGGFVAAHGKTPAKAMFRLRVVDQAGQKPSTGKALARALILCFSICFYFIPLLFVFFNPQRRTLHDMVAGTYVVEA